MNKLFRFYIFICFSFNLNGIILSTVLAQSLGALIPDFRVNDDLTNYTQEAPSIGVDGNGNFIITWNDRRNTPMNLTLQVYCQRFAFDGTRLGANFRMGQDTSGNSHIAVLNDGRFVVGWGGRVNGKPDIYFQRFLANGTPNGGMYKVNDTNSAGPFAGITDIAADSLGNFMIVWTDYRSGILNPDVYGQRYDSAGNRIGNNFRINDNSNNTEQVAPRVAVNKDGSYIICWVDCRNTANGDIYMQRFDRFGNPVGANQRVDDDMSSNGQGTCDAASDGKGYFVIAFDDFRELYNTAHVYYQLYDTLGNKIGVNQKADENTGQTGSWTTRVSMQPNGKFVIVWNDWRQFSTDIPFAQRFNKNGTKIGVNFQIPVFANFNNSGQVEVSLLYDRIYSTWIDTRNNNLDIFCNVRSFINPDSTLSGVNNGNLFARNFRLYPAYPNPFNPVTIISYELQVTSHVKLVLYDLRGKEIAVLVNGFKRTGLNNYTLNSNEYNLSSGIYFVKLIVSNGYEESIKIILLK